MSSYLVRINELCRRPFVRLKVLSQILTDLDTLKTGQEQIEEHLRRQDLMLVDILSYVHAPASATHAVFTVEYGGNLIEEATAVEMKVAQRFSCSVAFEDNFGNPATVDDPPVWTADPDGLVVLEPAADGLSVQVTAGGSIGSTQLLCKADADMGAGVTEITGMLDIAILPGDAVVVNLNPGPVTDVPPGP